MRRVSTIGILLAIGLFSATIGRAQQPSGRSTPTIVTGTVKDSSGGVLPAATVEAMVAGLTVATTTTGPEGRYRIELAPGARHRLRARLNGFGDEIVDVPMGSESVTQDFVLRIAAVFDTVVVTASRLPESRAAATEAIAVFTAGDIAALGSKSLADVVSMVPGLNVESNGREGALASLFSRGGESDYNLVLIDGVRVNANGGAFDFSRVSGAEIGRVEVVRGAQSSPYGSDAIGSVVQVFTKRAEPGDPPQLMGSLEGGSFSTWRGDARMLGGAKRRVDYQLGASHRGTDGAFADILPEHDRFDETTVDGGIGTIFGDRATLRTGLRYADATGKAVGPIAYGSRNTGTVNDTHDLSWHLDFTQRLTSRLNQSATATYFRSYRLSGNTIADPTYQVFAVMAGTPGAIFPASPRLVRLVDQTTFNALQSGKQVLGAGQFLAWTPYGVSDYLFTSESKFRRPAFKYQADLDWASNQVLSAGYEYERESDPLHPAFLAENHAYFIQQQFKAQDRWVATLGGRLDDNTRYSHNFSPKLSVGGFAVPYQTGAISSVKVFSNVGRGIKNPLFGELYSTAYSDGNPDLRPERARTVDAGAEITFDSQRVLGRVTYFNNVFNDQVAYKWTGPGLDGKPDFINIDGSKASGWEIEGALQKPLAGGLTASGAYSFVDTNVVSSVSSSEQFQPGQPLLRRPKHSALLRLAYARGRGSVNFNVRYVGERHDAAFLGLSALPSPQFPNGRSVDITVNPAYTLLWIGGNVRLSRDATVYLRIDNLTDTTYESALGYPGLPRSVVGGIRFTLGRRP